MAHARAFSIVAQRQDYAYRVGGSNGDLDFLEFIDGHSYKLQCRTASRTRDADFCMGVGLFTQISRLKSSNIIGRNEKDDTCHVPARRAKHYVSVPTTKAPTSGRSRRHKGSNTRSRGV